VIQIGVDLRWKNVLSSVSKRGSDASETFGHFTSCVGLLFGLDGYGWCAQASNLSLGFAFATSSANLPGECVSDTPGTRRSRPRADVSPMAIFASGLPDLIPE